MGIDEHNENVILFATDLKRDGVEVIFDRWQLKEGFDTYAFMEKSATDPSITNVLILLDPIYAEKADSRSGGVGGKSDSDLMYQDEVHGPLIEQVDKTVDLIYTKYLKALIDYKGIQRVEQYMFHRDAFREILLNAIVHKDYSGCNPIQISVYEDKMYIWNDGVMPMNLTSTEKLFQKHSSKPYNPKLADIFFKSGMIEAWGRGFDKIKEACEKYDGPLPEYDINEDGIMVLCNACERYLDLLYGKPEEINSLTSNERIMSELMSGKMKEPLEKILEYLKDNTEITNAIGQELTGKSTAQVRRYLNTLCDAGVIKSNKGTKGNVYLKK
ncbi:MAG: ATP-binding protein [Lachnospiraceae bacterium]|nr:ATP-binding protein [Lachnospiraceae bacterium]